MTQISGLLQPTLSESKTSSIGQLWRPKSRRTRRGGDDMPPSFSLHSSGWPYSSRSLGSQARLPILRTCLVARFRTARFASLRTCRPLTLRRQNGEGCSAPSTVLASQSERESEVCDLAAGGAPIPSGFVKDSLNHRPLLSLDRYTHLEASGCQIAARHRRPGRKAPQRERGGAGSPRP